MEPIYQKEFEVTDMFVDCYGRMKPSKILFLAQDIAGLHSAQLGLDYDTLLQSGCSGPSPGTGCRSHACRKAVKSSGWKPGPCLPPG